MPKSEPIWDRSEELISRPTHQETVWESKAFGFLMKIECRTPPSPADSELGRGHYEWTVSEDYGSPRPGPQFPYFRVPYFHLTNHSHTLALAQVTCILVADLFSRIDKISDEIEETVTIGQEEDANAPK